MLETSQHASVATSEAGGAGRGEVSPGARGLVRRDARWTRDTRVHGERSGVSGASTCCIYDWHHACVTFILHTILLVCVFFLVYLV